jgi:hypothetical protein
MLSFGMPFGFEEALNRKYSIMAMEAKARAGAADADAKLTNVKAGLLPAESNANVGLTRAQTGLAGAQTRSVDENTKFVAPLAKASIFNTRAQGSLFGQQAVGEYQLNRMSPTLAGGKGRGLGLAVPKFQSSFDSQLASILREGMGYNDDE